MAVTARCMNQTRISVEQFAHARHSAQRYSQAWLGTDTRCPASRHNQWVRLEQSVSFEHESSEDFPGTWYLTSSDLDLTVTATITDQRGTSTKAWSGRADADEVTYLGDVEVRGGRIGHHAAIELVAEGTHGRSTNRYVISAT